MSKKSIFVDNASLGQAGLQWMTDMRSQNGTITGNANCRMMYVNNMQQNNWNETNAWHMDSSVNNQTNIGNNGGGNIGGPPMQPQPQQGSFYQFNPQLSNISETDIGWRIEIVGFFNSSTPIGPFSVNLQITDQYNNWIDVNSQPGQGNTSPNLTIGVGEPGYIYGSSQDSWTFEKVDMQNNPVLSISKGAEWKMRFNVTSAQLTNVTVGLKLPWNIQQYVNVTGWYQQVVTQQGGWMYNDSSGNYYWNDTATITRNEQVYGSHLEQRWITLQNNNHQINATWMQWDPVTNTNKIVTQTQWAQDQLYLIYNHNTNTFDIEKGYSYSSYDTNLQRQVEYQCFSPLNMSDPSSQFYNLIIPDCNSYQTGPNNYVVEFAGSFSNTTSYDQTQYQLQISVCNANGEIWVNWQNTDPSRLPNYCR